MKKLRLWALILLVMVVALIIGLYIYLAFTPHPSHFWRSFSNAKVTINGHAAPSVDVYKQPDGKLLLQIDDRWYGYFPEERNICVGTPGRIRHVPLPGYIFVEDWYDDSYRCTLMSKEFTSAFAELVVQQNSIEFNTAEDKPVRINVTW